jgi:ParB/RepB/Spo0J family partition protein
MNAKKKTQPSGLGELTDLSGLLDTPAVSGSNRPVELPIMEIDEDPNQPRKTDNPGFSEESIAELAATIKLRGVKSPISVRESNDGRYIINHGARRYRAARVAGLNAIPAFVDNDYNEADQVIENLQRDNLTPREIADFIGRELARGKKKVQIAGNIGKSPAYITQHITLLDLPEPVALAFNTGRVSDVTLVNELVALNKKIPEQVTAWLADDSLELTRRTLKELSQGTLKKLQEEESKPDTAITENASDLVQDEEDVKNPFLYHWSDGTQVLTSGVNDRIEAVRKFSADECEAALALPDLEKTVKTAIERRLRKLEKEGVIPEEKQEDTTPKEKQPSKAHAKKTSVVITFEADEEQASVLAAFCERNRRNTGMKDDLRTVLEALERAIPERLRK